MSLETCAESLRTQDPHRFGCMMAAAPADRSKLVTLYALNLELARAPLQSADPLLAEMRLQWWIDRLRAMGQGDQPPSHDLLSPLHDAWGDKAEAMVPLAEGRKRDCDRQPFDDPAQVEDYVNATAGSLMHLAASALGADADAYAAVSRQALGMGLASWLGALPQLQAWNMGLVPQIAPAAARELARSALLSLDAAADARRLVPRRAAPALAAPAATRAFLTSVADGLQDPLEPAPTISPFRRRAALARLALTGRWWV
ncbi:squalene/phytoene synthase family protein [Paracoccus sp. TK19116]|uniref:Squalene/phytoene synthase family protein n=1 Tax=Paracoccus albicereus TaxID=2922394 RepID=A0ABT1MQN6_9RHOB|nr:squalene/phytoene synthase family protein [Paracoccus albicereus]MCQ0970024.1 squalene/phytoene synthase family protein [Paracoccus albicereus]